MRRVVKAESVENLGSERMVVFVVEAPRFRSGPVAQSLDDEETQLADPAHSRFTARLDMRREVRHGESFDLYFDLDRLYLFDAEDGSSLRDPAISAHDLAAVATGG